MWPGLPGLHSTGHNPPVLILPNLFFLFPSLRFCFQKVYFPHAKNFEYSDRLGALIYFCMIESTDDQITL